MTMATEDFARENDILQFADEVITYVLNELDGGDWQGQFSGMTDDEKRVFYKAIADGFNDTIDN